MKRLIFLLVPMLVIPLMLSSAAADTGKDQEAIKTVIISAYQEGICNVGDVDAIKKGYHPDFVLLGLTDDQTNLWKLPIAQWTENVIKKKAEGKYPPPEKISFKFLQIDVTGNAAMVKLEFYKGAALAYTDYLLLYKLKDGWKLVSKIYNSH